MTPPRGWTKPGSAGVSRVAHIGDKAGGHVNAAIHQNTSHRRVYYLANGHRRCSVLAQSTRMPTRFACGHSTNQLLKVRSSNRQPQKGVGWGPIARWWSPRKERQGSYDDAWLKDFKANFCADYPQDFNNSYFNCAPPDQMLKGSLQGDEHIELAGVFADKQTVSVQPPASRVSKWSPLHRAISTHRLRAATATPCRFSPSPRFLPTVPTRPSRKAPVTA